MRYLAVSEVLAAMHYSLLSLVLEETSFDVSISVDYSSRTLKAESHAINYLAYPKASDMPIARESLDAYEYLLDFRADPGKTADILGEIPGIKRLIELTTDTPDPPPQWLVEKYQALQPRKKEAMASLSALPHRVSFIAGVAGSGKSTLLEAIILAGQYGHCPTDTATRVAPKPDFPVLYVVPSNEGVDKFSAELAGLYEKLGFGANAPTVLRLYSMDSEVSSMLNKGKDKPKDPFNATAAAEQMATFSLGDHLMAEYQVVKLTTDSFNAKKMAQARKHRLRDMSLHAHAFQWLERNRPRYETLWQLLDLVAAKKSLTEVQEASWKAHTRVMYEEFLAQFKGIICCTPVAAAHSSVRTRFTPALVMIDENARMREPSTLMLIAYYNPKAWIIVGDPQQLKPFIALDIERKNPFRPSIEKSTLSRAAEAGAVVQYLDVNFRQYGDLVKLPSVLCYMGEMSEAYDMTFTEPVRNWVAYHQIHSNHPKGYCRLLIELPGSRTGKIGESTSNMLHAIKAFEIVRQILSNNSLVGEGKNRGNPARVLLQPFYRAQHRLYEIELDKLRASGKFSENQLSRVRLHTLDSSQGDEEDIVIADLAQTDAPGFTGDLHRICLMLTRPVIGQIILMDKDMWLCSDRNASIATRASVLRSVQLSMAKTDSILTIPCCDRCQTFGEHMSAYCPEKVRIDGQLETPRVIAAEAATTFATNVSRMHSASCRSKEHLAFQCPDLEDERAKKAICFNCGEKGHTSKDCTESKKDNRTCKVCNEKGHLAAGCPNRGLNTQCHNCKETGHLAKDCPEPKKDTRPCHECGERGHLKKNCPNITCEKCKQQGHIAPVCPNSRVKSCGLCGQWDHSDNACTNPKLECGSCGKIGHVSQNCRLLKPRIGPRKADPHDIRKAPQDDDAAMKTLLEINRVRYNEASIAAQRVADMLSTEPEDDIGKAKIGEAGAEWDEQEPGSAPCQVDHTRFPVVPAEGVEQKGDHEDWASTETRESSW